MRIQTGESSPKIRSSVSVAEDMNPGMNVSVRPEYFLLPVLNE